MTFVNTGTQTIHILELTATSDFSVQNDCTAVAPGANCPITVTSTPQTAGTHSAALEIATDAATSLEFVSLISTATPSPLTIAPASLNFGSVALGQTATLPVQVTNTGATPIAFTSVAASGDYSVAGTCPSGGATLAANSSCTQQVTFSPTQTGTRSGALSFTTSASSIPLTVALTGIGTQSKLLVTPSSLAFGNVVVGLFADQQITLANTGTATLNNIVLSISGDYLVSAQCGVSSLAPGASCTAQITFVPSAAGARNGTLTVTSSDPSSPLVVPLTGTGISLGGSFLLSVASATAAVVSGQPATYNLTVTPTGGFTGTVALTCTPLSAVAYASCSLLPSYAVLSNGVQTSVATINTVTSVAALDPPALRVIADTFFCLLAPCTVLVWRDRRSLRRHRLLLAAMFFCASTLFATGCAGKGNQANPDLRYTPAGTYQFQITASSTSGGQISQTLTLTLNVTAQ